MFPNISETIRTGRQQAELLRQYDGMSEDIGRLNCPFVIRSLPDGKALASGIFENDCWYGVLEDDCTVGSCIPYVIPDGFEDFSSKQIAALHTSNSLAVSPSGDKVAAALLGVNAISMSEYSSGELKNGSVSSVRPHLYPRPARRICRPLYGLLRAPSPFVI